MYFKSMVKKQVIILGTVLVGLTLQADSMLRIACDAQSSGATVTINGKFKGECPLDGVKVSEGNTHIRVVKLIDPTRYWLFEQNINMGDDVVKRIDVTFEKTEFTELGLKQEKERLVIADRQAKEQEKQAAIQAQIDAQKAKQVALEKEAAVQKVQADKKVKEDLAIQEASRVWLDKETNLMWQDDIKAKTIETNYTGAVRTCENLNYGMFTVCKNEMCTVGQTGYAGYKNWRMPSKDELEDLLREDKFKALKNVAYKFYYCYDWGIFYDWNVVRFDQYGHRYEGGEGSDNRNHLAVRCVRDNK